MFVRGQILQTDRGTYRVLVEANNSVLLSSSQKWEVRWWLVDENTLVRETDGVMKIAVAPVVPTA